MIFYIALYFIVGILFIIADRKIIANSNGFVAIFMALYTLISWPLYMCLLAVYCLAGIVITLMKGNLQDRLDDPFYSKKEDTKLWPM